MSTELPKKTDVIVFFKQITLNGKKKKDLTGGCDIDLQMKLSNI